ncbi:DUF6531 domain-containing protein, partial [Stenotrophomonas sp. CFBP 13725]|uniref:DUF6531 domain-containing protein n=1 Tax=Stenotrophomonas sp. CFBP 13725 TaxID=2775297 RepID=UPI00177D09F3
MNWLAKGKILGAVALLAPSVWLYDAHALDPSKEKKEEDPAKTAPPPPPTNLPRMTVTAPLVRDPPPFIPGVHRQAGMGGLPSRSFQTTRTAKAQETDDRRDCSSGDQTGGNPVVLYTGNKVENELDFSSNGEMGLFLSRTYNHHWNASGLFGNHWLSNFDESLAVSQNGDILWVQRPDGRRVRYLQDVTTGRWFEDKAQPIGYIVRNTDGSYRLYDDDRSIEDYSNEGYILRKQNEQGVAWTYTYTGKYLQRVTHSSGRFIQFGWNNGQLTQVTDPAGAIYRYTYAANAFGQGRHRLSSATLPGAPETTVTYHYEDTRYPGGLTGKSLSGSRYSTFAYDNEARAVLSEHAGATERHQFSYVVHTQEPVGAPPPPARPGGNLPGESNGWCVPRGANGTICYQPASLPGGSVPMASASGKAATTAATTASRTRPVKISTVTTNPYGRKTTSVFDDGKLLEVAGEASPRCAASFKSSTYDANGYPDLVHDFENNLTNYDYSPKGLLIKEVAAAGSAAERTSNWQWDPTTNRLVSLTVQGLRRHSYTYDSRGNVATITTMNLSSNGVPQQARVLRYTYTYHSNGLKASVKTDGPLAQDDVTETFNAQGDLTSFRNALGHQVSYANYNGLGMPRKITGPNGDVTEVTYDARGRITSQKQSVGAGWAVSSTTFDAAGNVASVTQPNGSTTRFTYDAARRLLQEFRPIGDGTFAWTHHTYDVASNVTRTEVRHTDYPMGSTVTGTVEGINHDANWNWSVGGWACSTGSNSSIDVHAYTDDGTLIGGFTANRPSETQVAAACQANGSAYRFQFPITLAQRHQLGGKRINVYGISPMGGVNNKLLPGSGTVTIPEAPVLGAIHGINRDAAFNYRVDGWACAVGYGS